MAEHSSEEALNLLNSWQKIISQQAEILAQGDIQGLEGLIRQSVKIQHHLKKILVSSKAMSKDKRIVRLLKDLHAEQGKLIDSLRGQTEELSQKIGELRKNMTSIRGYKQKESQPPRFMNERT